MDFRERFSKTDMGTTVVSTPRTGGDQFLGSKAVLPAQPIQDVAKKKSASEGSELLKKLRNGEVIEYQGLKFDTQKLKVAQARGKLPNFDFVIQDNETGIAFRSEKHPDRRFLVLMPPDQLESLINIAIARDNGEKKEEQRPENPHEWQFQSKQPQYLVETPEGRRPMTPKEMRKTYKQAVNTVFEMHDLGIINMGDMIDKYAEKIGGMKGAAFKGLYHATPLFMFKKKIEGYSKDVVDRMKKRPEYEAMERAEFEKEKAAAVAQYDMEERVKKEEMQKVLAEKQKKEEQRLAALVPIKGTSFRPTIEDSPYEKTLSFEEENKLISITHSKVTNKAHGQIGFFDEHGNWMRNKEIQPEEWRDIARVLAQKLTTDQKEQLGSDFLKAISDKMNGANKPVEANIGLQLAYRSKGR